MLIRRCSYFLEKGVDFVLVSYGFCMQESITDWVIENKRIDSLRILEAGSLKSRCW